MRSEQRAQEYASYVLHSSALIEQHRAENRRWDLLNADEFAPAIGTPRKIQGEQGDRHNWAHHGTRNLSPRAYMKRSSLDDPTSLDLPKGYYEARIAMNRRQRGA